MMDEIASHILDIVANSVAAKAKNIDILITKDTPGSRLSLMIRDDGVGMDEDMAKNVQDPFFSTKTGRKVGLGVPLLKGTAETTGGRFSLNSKVDRGTEISVEFDLNHPDLPPLGNIRDTLFVLIVSNPEVDFVFVYRNNEKGFVLDTKEVKCILEGIPINNPEVIKFLGKYLDESLEFI